MNVARIEKVSDGGEVLTLYGVLHGEAHEDGAALVRDVEGFLRRFVVLPAHTPLPLALWSIATFMFELFDAFPYLVITSPTKQCGKTRLLECLELLTHEPRRAANPSEAALFRMIEKYRPTLLLDEGETLNGRGERAEYLRALLNAGNRRNASVPRCVGQGTNQDVQEFSIYCPKIVAGNVPLRCPLLGLAPIRVPTDCRVNDATQM